MTPPLIAWSYGAAAFTSIVAAVTDSRTGRIPNWLTLPTIVIAIVTVGLLRGLTGTVTALLGLLLGAAVPATLYKISRGKAIGGGDVKLFATLGALLGPTLAVEMQFGAFALLCVFAVIRLAFRGLLLRTFANAAARYSYVPRLEKTGESRRA